MPRTIFLSHSSRDARFAHELCRLLEDQGISCWMAPRDVPKGAEWDAVIPEAIDNSPGFLLLLSVNSARSEQVAKEVYHAAKAESKKIFPVRMEEVEPVGKIGFHLQGRHWTDLWNAKSLEDDVRGLVGQLEKIAGGGGEAPGGGRRSAAPKRPLAMDGLLSTFLPEPERIDVTAVLRREVRTGEEGRARETGLLLEQLCCDLSWFRHVVESGAPPESIDINQEVNLGTPEAFADIRVTVQDDRPYFIEIKLGYSSEDIVAAVRRKYRSDNRRVREASKLVLVVDTSEHRDWQTTREQIEKALEGVLDLEVWDLPDLLASVEKRFGVRVERISRESLVALGAAVEEAKGRFAFGDDWRGDPVQSNQLWHLGFWRARQLRRARGEEALGFRPGKYSDVVTLIADISSFSDYVRDSPDLRSAREALATFYAKARYEVLATGGMLYQFAGDRVYAFYGLPDRPPGYLKAALRCARAITDLGESISNRWQRQLHREQQAKGVHIGIVLGEVHLVAMAPFSRSRPGAVSDSINLAAQLVRAAAPGEILVGNTLYQRLDQETQGLFRGRKLPGGEGGETFVAYKMI